MAKGKIEGICCVCGEGTTKEKFFSKRSEADAWESYMKDTELICAECWKREQEESLLSSVKEVVIQFSLPYPELKGSEKQVSWANRIRAEYIHALHEAYKDLSALNPQHAVWNSDEPKAKAMQTANAPLLALLQSTKAKDWIDAHQQGLSFFRRKI